MQHQKGRGPERPFAFKRPSARGEVRIHRRPWSGKVRYGPRFATDDLLDNYAPALIWNRPSPPKLWFHYTARPNARAIVGTRAFRVGTTHATGRAGIYVCPYQPGALTEDELAAKILDGSFHDRERLQAVVVLAAGPDVAFGSDRDTPDGMRFLAEPGALVRLPNQVVGWAESIDGAWRHSGSLFDALALGSLMSKG